MSTAGNCLRANKNLIKVVSNLKMIEGRIATIRMMFATQVDIEYSFPSLKVIDRLKRVIEWKGKLEEIRSDNGTEVIAKAFGDFCSTSGINHLRIQKGKPMQNGFIERFNRTYREDILDMHIFENIDQVREKTEEFLNYYNNYHPHDSLNNMSPIKFLKTKYQKKMPTFTR